MKRGVPYLSVIIPTMNRAEALRSISLSSLTTQEMRDFEVIVWDASNNDASRLATEAFTVANQDLPVRYFKAPRKGLCAQRNDAVTAARGEIVFFIDDDSEVSHGGIAALKSMFIAHKELSGVCLQINYFTYRANPGLTTNTANRWCPFLQVAYCRIFDSLLAGSGVFAPSSSDRINLVDRLPGCDMAYRKAVFCSHSFDERLQRYGGWALWEDLGFSHRLYREGLILSVAEKGRVIHRAAPGTRAENQFDRGRMDGYNAGIVWEISVFPFARWSVVRFAWSRIGFLCVLLALCFYSPWRGDRWKRLAGYLAGLWVFIWEELVGFAPRKT